MDSEIAFGRTRWLLLHLLQLPLLILELPQRVHRLLALRRRQLVQHLHLLGRGLEDLLRKSDFVTIHVPLTPQTSGMIGRKQIASMKPGAILINAARGGLVDELALADALASGHLAGAGLDVMEPAPPDPEHPLLKQENVIITPHTAFFSQASTLELETRTAQEVVRVADGGEPENFINPEVRGKSRVGL